MSDEDSCDADTGDPNLQIPSNIRSDDSAESGDCPAPTSRISVKHVVDVVNTFSEFKRFLVTSIGFGGMLDLQMLQKLNLKFSAWTMSKVSTSRRAIILAKNKILRFWPEDVHKVFGIPCGHRNIKGRDGHIKPEAIRFIKSTLGMDRKGVHSLRAAEEFLMRDITESSSKLEKDCFQIAFVIFVMGHVLAPTTKHDYATIDFWGALANTETIEQFNWCDYVIQCMLAGVMRLKNDIRSGNPVSNLVGCHLWLQIFVLDNLDLGIYNKQHGTLPRVKDFDQASFRRMIVMATDIGKPVTSYASAPIRHRSSVCYARSKFPDAEQSASRNTANSPPEQSFSCGRSTAETSKTADDCQTPTRQMLDEFTPTTIRLLGPMDFCNYLRRQYPHLANDEITLLLKEINARCLSHLATARGHIQLDMMKFADKIIDASNRTCTCCAARGFGECPPKPTTTMKEVDITMPARNVIAGHRLHLSPCEGNTSTSKRPKTVMTPQQNPAPVMGSALTHILHMVTQFAKDNVRAISQLYIDLPNDGSTTVFGERHADLPGRKYVHRPGFQTDPWGRGVVPYPPQPGVAELIEQFFTSATHNDLARNYLVHEEPRFIRISGLAIRDQLASTKAISHEMMSVLLRRYAQLDSIADNVTPYLCWRHPIEPDFSTLVLSDSDFLHTVSIQKQLSSDSLKHDITSCQMFFTPVPRPEGWTVLAWDMQLKVLHLLDPLYHKSIATLPYKDRDQAMAWKLHTALYACLNELYAGWPSAKENWRLRHEPMTDVHFSAAESGACAIHIARHFDGVKLKLPLTQQNVLKTKKETLHECLKLQGNFSALPHEALWKVLAPSDSAFDD